jgi:hypothetical protein
MRLNDKSKVRVINGNHIKYVEECWYEERKNIYKIKLELYIVIMRNIIGLTNKDFFH